MTRSIGGATRDCIIVRLDDGQGFEIALEARDYFPFLSRVRAVLLRRDGRPGAVVGAVSVDGRPVSTVTLAPAHDDRIEFARPRVSFVASFVANGDAGPLCVTLTERAWNLRRGERRRRFGLPKGFHP